MNNYTSDEMAQIRTAVRQHRRSLVRTRDSYDQLAAIFTSGTREQADAWLTGKGWKDRSHLQDHVDSLNEIYRKLFADSVAESRAESDAITERRTELDKYDGVPADTGSL